MKILVVDDEKLGRQRIINLLKELKDTTQIFEASSGKETLKVIKEVKPEMMFLDIQMTDMTGFEVLKAIPSSLIPVTIFATAFDSYAVKAFEFQAVDFLLKPFNNERFLLAFERAKKRIEINHKEDYRTKISNVIQYIEKTGEFKLDSHEGYLDKITLKTNNKYSFIPTSEIMYIKSSAYYAEIYLRNQDKKVHRISSMTDLVSKLDPSFFIRVNRSTIIRIDMVKNLVSEGLGDYSIIMDNGEIFQLTKKYKAIFLKRLNVKG